MFNLSFKYHQYLLRLTLLEELDTVPTLKRSQYCWETKLYTNKYNEKDRCQIRYKPKVFLEDRVGKRLMFLGS